MPVESEAKNDQNAHQAECYSYDRAESSGGSLRLHRCGQAPLAQEIPDAGSEMERRGEYASDKERQVPRILQVLRDVCVRRSAMPEPPFGVKVPPDVGEGDPSCVAAQRVQTLPCPRIVEQ